MIELAAGDWAARLLPERGAAFAALTWRGQEVLATLPDGADPNASFAGAFLMAPWCNRLDAGRLGEFGVLPVSRPLENTALHGLARDRGFAVLARDIASVSLAQRAAYPPFAWEAEVTVQCGEALRLDFTLRNTGPRAIPMGCGWHPWFRRTPETTLRFMAREMLTPDARGLPLLVEPSAGIAAPVHAIEGMDHHFAGWDGMVEIARPGLAVRLAASGAWAGNLQIFAPHGADVLCAEPVSHVPDAPNRPDLASFGAMRLLAPGEALHAALEMRCLA